MFSGSHALQAFTAKDLLTIRRGSCVRHRFAKSNCRYCLDICPSKALEWREDGLHWETSLCQGCLLCTTGCPNGALQASEISLVALLQDLAEIERPVLACSAEPKTAGHARVPCLGFFASPELLLAMTLALGRTIRLNLTACADCRNATVTAPLVKAVQELRNLPVATAGTVELVYTAEALDFKERSCNRREFFSLLRNRSQRAGVCVADRLQADGEQEAYGIKKLPATRQLLLQVLRQLPDQRESIGRALFPQRVSNGSCQACTGCVGICPVGALVPPTDPGAAPGFHAEHCVTCHLCESFCINEGLTINSPGE